MDRLLHLFCERSAIIIPAAKDTGALAETYLEIRGLYSSKAEYAKAEEQVFDALRLYEKTSNKKVSPIVTRPSVIFYIMKTNTHKVLIIAIKPLLFKRKLMLC
ncbi:MAG: hypothetical protein R2759_15610 [Bacteroidales bacterium]